MKLDGFQRARLPGFTASTKNPDLQRVEGSRIPELQGCRILRLQGPRFKSSKIAQFWDYRVPELLRAPSLQCHRAKFQAGTMIPRRQVQIGPGGAKPLGLLAHFLSYVCYTDWITDLRVVLGLIQY